MLGGVKLLEDVVLGFGVFGSGEFVGEIWYNFIFEEDFRVSVSEFLGL